MNQKKHHSHEAAQPTQPSSELEEGSGGGGGGGGAVVESPEAAVQRLTEALAELQDRHLRLAAEYDNFRKRSAKERTELWPRAQAELLGRLVDALDDLARFAHLESAQANVETLRAGVELVERKFARELEALGVRRIDAVGVPFDPAVHEAVTTAAAPDPAQDHTVGAVLQAGYKLGDLLIRPARVQVLTWKGEGEE